MPTRTTPQLVHGAFKPLPRSALTVPDNALQTGRTSPCPGRSPECSPRNSADRSGISRPSWLPHPRELQPVPGGAARKRPVRVNVRAEFGQVEVTSASSDHGLRPIATLASSRRSRVFGLLLVKRGLSIPYRSTGHPPSRQLNVSATVERSFWPQIRPSSRSNVRTRGTNSPPEHTRNGRLLRSNKRRPRFGKAEQSA